MQAKTTRAFRTISEAGDELGLQPHVLRFWESKFSQIKPIKRGGGRRFYRPEDIEFLRGIKILLHDEKHPIKDVQKLIRVKGASRVVELGQSVERAAREKDVADTVLVPERIRKATETIRPVYDETPSVVRFKPKAPAKAEPAAVPAPIKEPAPVAAAQDAYVEEVVVAGLSDKDRQSLQAALDRLTSLRSRWEDFKNSAP